MTLFGGDVLLIVEQYGPPATTGGAVGVTGAAVDAGAELTLPPELLFDCARAVGLGVGDGVAVGDGAGLGVGDGVLVGVAVGNAVFTASARCVLPVLPSRL